MYAYLLAFIILALITALVRVFTRPSARKEPTLPPTHPAAPTSKPEVGEASKPITADSSLVAAAVAAVTTHLSLHKIVQPATVVHTHPPTYMWMQQWRTQVSRSPNDLCLIKYTQRKLYT
ncbi:MAG: hypothetical protein RMI56_02150 [Sulfolobales archaeon]|nr:hypothetical protein [Sulfolobales archaeon]MDW8082579.1 hypothetical protein [Sulfolobales archaeon]